MNSLSNLNAFDNSTEVREEGVVEVYACGDCLREMKLSLRHMQYLVNLPQENISRLI